MMTQTVDQTASVLSSEIHIRYVERSRHQNLQDVQFHVVDIVVVTTIDNVARIASVMVRIIYSFIIQPFIQFYK